MTPAPPATTESFSRYLIIFFATLVGIVGAAWIYTANVPVAFMESGYASWAAKRAMLRQCRVGQIAFFGDSRLEAGLVPADFPVPVSNFGLAAGTAIEARIAVDRMFACPTLPRQAVISLVPDHFGPVSRFYWLLSLRYGFLSPGDALAVERLAAELGDPDSLATPTPDGLSGPVRDWLYAVHFPSLSFSSLVAGRVIGRYGDNHARIDSIERARGWTAYAGGERVRSDHPNQFVLTKLQNAELEAALTALRAKGVAAALLIMPFATDHEETDATLAAYRDYLAAVAQRTGAVLLDPAIPFWPPDAFADGAHLNAPAAHDLSKRLATCLQDGVLATCSLSR